MPLTDLLVTEIANKLHWPKEHVVLCHNHWHRELWCYNLMAESNVERAAKATGLSRRRYLYTAEENYKKVERIKSLLSAPSCDKFVSAVHQILEGLEIKRRKDELWQDWDWLEARRLKGKGLGLVKAWLKFRDGALVEFLRRSKAYPGAALEWGKDQGQSRAPVEN
jgi:hypothetical protein